MIIDHFLLAAGPVIPNNPNLPVIAYRQAVTAGDDLAGPFEVTFTCNGWQGIWRNGIYDFHHYHSTAHEVLGIARGYARVVLGGPGGMEFAVAAGDCLLLPAGTGHCRLAASTDFLVIGAYPPGQHADMQTKAPTAAMLQAISRCPLPDRDPVDAAEQSVRHLWGISA